MEWLIDGSSTRVAGPNEHLVGGCPWCNADLARRRNAYRRNPERRDERTVGDVVVDAHSVLARGQSLAQHDIF